MTQIIDLMPETCRKRLGQRRLIRQWITVYAATITLLIVGASLVRVMERARLAEVRVLRDKVQLDAGQATEAEKLRKSIERIQADIDRHARLSWPVRISDIVAAIGEMTPESVSLTSFSVTPRSDRGRSRAGVDASKRLVIEIKGLAPDDLHMSNFVAGLETHPLFNKVAVDFSKKTSLRGFDAREFGLTCEIDASARYVFADPDGEDSQR